jgi:PIN domain nuclease of toxin-antitoxin system
VTFLDTHALVWVLKDPPRLGRRAARIASQALANDTLWTSAIVFWELSLLVASRRLQLDSSAGAFRHRVLGFGIKEAALTGEIALAAAALSGALKDPADCFVTATTAVHHGRLMTADRRLIECGLLEVVDASQ